MSDQTFATLAGKRIAVLAADGVEHAEVQEPAAALQAAGAQVLLIAPHPGRIRSMQVHQPGELLRVDMTVAAAAAADYDGLFVPGGYISPDSLRQLAPARELVRQMHELGKPLAFLSQAALLLVSSGLARQRVLTSWPGVRDDMVNAGAIWLNRPVVRDGHCLFGRGVQDIAAFVADLPAFFAGEPAAASAPAPTQSDPPQEAPAELPDQPLRWLSAPSVRAMLSLALLGVGMVAVNQGRRRRNAKAADDTQEVEETPPVADPAG
jgi:protease I